ncbi:ATP-binding protein [Desulfolutivibrio sp.]|uniref:ATP-binding protein n=1 Tax=Desulfolutivibrio sp. TaxID=2773296 RepID=UPI002F96E15B
MDDMKIEASPTKEFFINMLVRDIPLVRAILDLIDNAVDSAKRIRPNNDFTGLKVSIQLEDDRFSIRDNCGGMTLQIAKEYAFRFGRPKKAELTARSIGRFGVGMKRTIFKLGNYFEISSKTISCSFSIQQDVQEWVKNEEWEFHFSDIKKEENNIEKTGTKIVVTKLHKSISEELKLEHFRTTLINEIETAYPLILKSGLAITLNKVPVNIRPLEMLTSGKIVPAFFQKTYSVNGHDITVTIYAGLAERSKSESGWYIFCNGRMVLEHDQTFITGWGEGNGKTIPKYHTNFAFFRGYVFFDSDDAEALPWTTTKTGLDTDLPLYKSIRLEMIKQMRPIVKFLSDLAKEKSEKESGDRDEAPLEIAIQKTTATWFDKETIPTPFIAPKSEQYSIKPLTGRIQYNATREKIKKVKLSLGVTTNTDVGRMTFDYYYENECE